MGVRRCPRVCALLVLGAVLATGAGCRGGDDADNGGIAGDGSPLINGPDGKLLVNSSSPGLEPPVNTPGAGAGAMTPTTGGPTAPAAGMGANPAQPGATPAGGSGGSPDVGASGAGGMGGQMSGSDPMHQDGGMGDSGMDDPCAEPSCGVDQPCQDSSLHCIQLDLCDHAVCITTEAACQAECDEPSCAILESYPEQIACD